jgi:hypothetical protein
MNPSSDFEDLFKTLNAHRVKYIVVGAHAVMHYATPRFTKDLDVWIPPDLNKSARVFEALADFGAPLDKVSPADFTDPKLIYQIGIAPVRIDVMMDIQGVSARDAWKRRTRVRYGKTMISVLSLDDLIRAKKRSGRPQDQLDLQALRQAKRDGA